MIVDLPLIVLVGRMSQDVMEAGKGIRRKENGSLGACQEGKILGKTEEGWAEKRGG